MPRAWTIGVENIESGVDNKRTWPQELQTCGKQPNLLIKSNSSASSAFGTDFNRKPAN